MHNLFYQPTPQECETRKRIKLCVAAYAYECRSDSIMSDGEFDMLAQSVDLSIETKHQEWWQRAFNPSTGQWIHTHPDLSGIGRIYHAHYAS